MQFKNLRYATNKYFYQIVNFKKQYKKSGVVTTRLYRNIFFFKFNNLKRHKWQVDRNVK
jgi:hypothetical protein